MALSNTYGWLVVSTGNKSELAVGYCTLYGDMSGGLGVIADVPKTMVYRIARWLNERSKGEPVIPLPILSKAPSAELRPNQTDQDTLPPYDVLDAILHGLIEEEQSIDQIVSRGFPRHLVARIQHMLYSAEYKRRQAPPGVRVSAKAFGKDRRLPITNRWSG